MSAKMFLFPLLACLLLVGCATPGETHTSYLVQGKIQNMINSNELVRGHVFGGKVLDTKVISIKNDVVTEHWYVERGDREVIYIVQLIPNAEGGTDLRFTLPEEDRQ